MVQAAYGVGRSVWCLHSMLSIALSMTRLRVWTLTAVITEAASPEGMSIGRKIVATGHVSVVELRVLVTVVEAAAGKLAGVLLLLAAATE